MTLRSLVEKLKKVRLGFLVVEVRGIHLRIQVEVRKLPHKVSYLVPDFEAFLLFEMICQTINENLR